MSQFYHRIAPIYSSLAAVFMPSKKHLHKHVKQAPAGKLLDVGCGNGKDLVAFYKHDVWGIDDAKGMVSRPFSREVSSRLIHANAVQLPFPNASFDYVTLSHVLSTTEQPERILSEIKRVLKPNGLLWIQNHDSANWRIIDLLMSPFAGIIGVRLPFYLNAQIPLSDWEIIHQQKLGRFSYFNLITLRRR